jgi:hypothetical protein
MDVATMKMPREEARAKLKEYRRGLHRRADAEWEMAAVAYEAAAEGKALLVLSQVIANAPRDSQGRPRLAIARADQRQVRYEAQTWGGRFERFVISSAHPRLLNREINVVASANTPLSHTQGYALVPMVPPAVRGRMDLRTRFILWEVEEWSDRIIGAAPDRDPYLLERVAGDFYAVVGEWDLTEIERAVMRDRARG